MNIKRFVRKNYMLIIVLVLIFSSYYYISNYEPFQATINLGTCVSSNTSRFTLGTCPSGYMRDPNHTLNKCSKNIHYCGSGTSSNIQASYNMTTDANGNKQCQHKTTRAISQVKVDVQTIDYTCPAGSSRISDFRCAPTGNLICPPPSQAARYRTTSPVIDETYCLICPPSGTVPRNTSRNACIARFDSGKNVWGTRADAVCSV